jgi:hypothetical protein
VHPAEHRALRELHAFTGQLRRHWSSLAGRVGGDEAVPLRAGAEAAGELQRELEDVTTGRGLATEQMVRVASRFATARPAIPDRALERNQALRFAALDAQHVVTLLGYVANLAAGDGDDELRTFCARWERKLRTHERAVRLAAIALGERPDEAIRPADGSPAGRAAAKVNAGIGAFGEWVDRRSAAKRG